MILTKTPFRISFVGGGSDHFNLSSQIPGRVICTTINKYMYIAVNKKHDDKVRLSYSITENVNTTKHRIGFIIYFIVFYSIYIFSIPISRPSRWRFHRRFRRPRKLPWDPRQRASPWARAWRS